MAPPQLGDEQVVCGPDWKDERAPNGRWLSLHTPAGSYDLSAVAAKLPPEQQPDVVVCLVDASWRNTPCGLSKFSCPRVLLVADTHHLHQPLAQMIRYAASEPFTRVVLLYDRHHVEFFRAAGVKNLFWFPGLTFPHSDAIVRQSRQTSRAAQIGFVGQVGKHHPRRARLAEALTARKLPLRVQPLRQAAAMNFYGASLLGFNASLNGDLNLRVFEILASGAALLTDALAPASGLATLLGEGREMITYRSPEELAERAAHALARRAETQAIGAAGAKWFDARFNERRRRDAFRALAFDGVTLPEFALEQGRVSRVWFGGDKLRLNQAVGVYEMMQELHRAQETVTIACDASVPTDVVELYETLPRMKVVRAAAAADLAICSRTQASGEFSKHAARVWCWDAGASELPVLAKHLQASGLALQGGAHALFARDGASPIASAAEDLPELLKRAAEKLAQEDFTAAASLAERAVKMDNKNVTAYGLLGRGFRGMQRFDGALVAFKLAAHLEPKNLEWKCELGTTQREAGKVEDSIATLQAAVRLDARHGASWFALGQSLFAAKRYEAAANAFQRARTLAPNDGQALLWLGHALKRQGRLLEALQLHQRAVGGSGDVSAPAPGTRRRALFVVQHGPFWPSTASVYRSFAADPSWEVTVVALPYHHPYYTTDEERNAVFDFLKKEGIPHVHWTKFPLTAGCADVVFLQNPYDIARPEGWRTHELMRVVPRIAYIPYALEIGGGLENATMQVNLTTQQLAWSVFARSPRHRSTFANLCDTGDAHVAVTGHPKMDNLRDLGAIRDDELERFIAGRKMVFWNPQFDVRPDGSVYGKGYSTFLRWQEFLPGEFTRRQDLAFVIRPHPLFFATMEQRRILTAEQIREFLDCCAAAGNILIDRRPSYLPVFAYSAALITDASSFVLEYAGTGKPLLYLHNPNGPGLNADGEFVREHCATALAETDIAAFLDAVAAGRDERGEARRAAYRDYMHLPAEGVGAAIKRTIEQRLSAEFTALRERRAA